jgi:hypothetical protein
MISPGEILLIRLQTLSINSCRFKKAREKNLTKDFGVIKYLGLKIHQFLL